MDPAKQRLLDLIQVPFDGGDVVEAVSSPTALDNLHMVFDPLVTEDFVSEMVADSSFRQERTGVEGFHAAWCDWAAPFDRLQIDVVEVHDVDDKLLTIVEQVGVPKGGESELRSSSAAVWTLSDGLLSRVEFHLDTEQARRAAGLKT
jgi:hypothetical protein